jgi:hypothetical protein
VDVLFEDQQFQFTNFVHWITWVTYFDIMSTVGAGLFPGAFAVRGLIQVVGSDLFDMALRMDSSTRCEKGSDPSPGQSSPA